MRIYPLALTLLTGLLLLLGRFQGVAAQGLPPRSLAFEAQGTDSATGNPIAIRLAGKSLGAKGRQYTGTCSIKAGGKASALAGEWRLTQNSNPMLAGGTQPAIAGLGTRVGARPLRTGQTPTAAGQAINFTIEGRPDGRYQVLLLDAFSDESLEFVYPAGPTGK